MRLIDADDASVLFDDAAEKAIADTVRLPTEHVSIHSIASSIASTGSSSAKSPDFYRDEAYDETEGKR